MFNPSEHPTRLRCRRCRRRHSQVFIAISFAILGQFTGPASARSATAAVGEFLTGPQAHETSSVPHRQETRTVTLDMHLISFSVKSVSVTEGETIRFVLNNTSPIAHDFTIGSSLIQQGRRAVISEMKEAEILDTEEGSSARYDAPNAVLVLPGETKEVVWKFTKTQRLEFGCNLPGHYEMGMKGKFRVRPIVDYTVAYAAADRHPEIPAAGPTGQATSVEPAVRRKLSAVLPVGGDVNFPTPDGSPASRFNIPAKLLWPNKVATSTATGPERPSQQFVQNALQRHLEAAKARRRKLLRKHWREPG